MGLDWQLKNEAVLPTLAPPPRGTSPRRSHRVFTPVLQAFPHTLPALHFIALRGCLEQRSPTFWHQGLVPL